MKKRSAGLISFIFLFLVGCFAGPVRAQTAAATKPARPAPMYDASKETTLSGTVSNVVTKPGVGMIGGGHLIVATAQGAVDAHVGGRALSGPKAMGVKAGEAVKLTGVMATVNHNQIFLVRTVETGGRTYTIRNEHGFLLGPTAKRGTSTVPVGGSLR